MSLLVFECGSRSWEPTIAVWKEILADSEKFEIHGLRPSHEKDMEYEGVQLSLAEVARRLSEGVFSSLMISCDNGTPSLILIYRPFFCGSRLPLWMIHIEQNIIFSTALLEPFKKNEDLLFISVSLEDTLDLETREGITVESFPWDHWRLLCAAVRKHDRTWEQRLGPAATAYAED